MSEEVLSLEVSINDLISLLSIRQCEVTLHGEKGGMLYNMGNIISFGKYS